MVQRWFYWSKLTGTVILVLSWLNSVVSSTCCLTAFFVSPLQLYNILRSNIFLYRLRIKILSFLLELCCSHAISELQGT